MRSCKVSYYGKPEIWGGIASGTCAHLDKICEDFGGVKIEDTPVKSRDAFATKKRIYYIDVKGQAVIVENSVIVMDGGRYSVTCVDYKALQDGEPKLKEVLNSFKEYYGRKDRKIKNLK